MVYVAREADAFLAGDSLAVAFSAAANI